MTIHRTVELGWRNSSPQAALAFFPPEPLSASDAVGLTALFPGQPAGADLARRVFVIRSAFNARIRIVERPGQPAAYHQVPEPGALSPEGFKGLVTPIVPSAQRGGVLPACQISLNLIFISDVPCSIQLMPAFFWPGFRRWPGSIVCGRFPVRAWPRPLNCVLEWVDRDRDWMIRRGDPMACVMPIYERPDMVPDLFEAKMTPTLKRHLARIEGVGDMGRNVGPMFARAERARPARLLERKTAPDVP